MAPTLRSVSFALTLALLALPDTAQEGRPGRGGGGGDGDEGGGKAAKKDGPKPYDEVVTEDFDTTKGLFLIHRDADKILYEIPPAELGQEFLWVTQLAETQAGFGYGGTGVGNRVVRWELRDETVLLRDVKYSIRGGAGDTLENAVEATSLAPIIQAFPVAAWGKDQAPVVDVSSVFTSDLPEFSAKSRLDASGVDGKRTFIDSVKAFPENIETKVLMTYKLSPQSADRGGSAPRGPRTAPRRDRSQGAVTVKLHHSMVKLPDDPLTPRVHDERVGFFSVSFEDYDADDHEVETTRYITRWRLEKQDPEASVSDPVEPIVFYVGRGVPEKWRPYVKSGIEMWQPAFESAGFSNAIRAADPPTEREDPDWDAEDARYSTIRWLPSTVENAMGPHVHDPRTGEILEADILMFHNVLKLIRDWYFVQASPNDERAQKLPLPDDLLGECLAYVVAHEVGHSLGFPHNMKASSSYTVAQLRDPAFTNEFGTEASIMDYGRFNYVAQPGDGARLIPIVGPYDKFAAQWGYGQYDSAQAEAAGLAALVAKQVDDPMLRFGDPNPGEDPSQQTEDLGNETLLATELGLANIDRVAGYLVEACCAEGEDYDLLENVYGRLVGQRDRELGHVTNLVGGVVRANLWYGDADSRYEPVDAELQREAVEFLHQNSFHPPASILSEDVLQRLDATGAADRILGGQRRILGSLLNRTRIDRMAEQATRNAGSDAGVYTPLELLSDVRGGVWCELSAGGGEIDLYRRNLQRAHVEILAEAMNAENATASDLPALAREELATLLLGIDLALGGESPATTRAHLADLQARIREHLNPLLERSGVPTGPIEASAARSGAK